MAQNNFERMVRLAEEFFATKNDPSQLTVTPAVIARLKELHPLTLTERVTDDGPIVWILLIPTTRSLMRQFLACEIGERELFEKTRPGEQYESLYLCSALVLPEFRKKGMAYSAAVEAIAGIRRDHPLTALFVWEFSQGGKRLAESLARSTILPLFRRIDHGSDRP